MPVSPKTLKKGKGVANGIYQLKAKNVCFFIEYESVTLSPRYKGEESAHVCIHDSPDIVHIEYLGYRFAGKA